MSDEQTGGPDIEDVAEKIDIAKQSLCEIKITPAVFADSDLVAEPRDSKQKRAEHDAWLLGYSAGRLSIHEAHAERDDAIHRHDTMVYMFATVSDRCDQLGRSILRVRALMADPDPYRQDLGPDGTFNVPCVLVSDLREALDG